MFRTFFGFELWLWIKALMVWIFLAVLTLLILSLLLAEEAILEDVFFGHAFRNSPFVIQRLYGIAAVFGCLMVTAFVNSAATRDIACDTHQLIFTKPISKRGYLLGRFLGAMLISLIPMLGVSIAVLIAQLVSPGPQWGPNLLSAHVSSILLIAAPNTFFIAAVVFAIAIWTRSTLASFIGILALMVVLSISGALIGSLASESMAAMTDPFGDTALANMTKYWTTAEKNTQLVPLTGLLLWNRVLWVGIGGLLLAASYWRFSFTSRPGLIGNFLNSIKSSIDESLALPFHTNKLPHVTRNFGTAARIRQWLSIVTTELWATARSPVFICLMIGAFLTVVASLSVRKTLMFGLSTLPVTISIVEIVRDSLFQIQVVLITFYAGVFVWKERDAKMDEVHDALPIPDWLSYLGKLAALFVIVLSVITVGVFCALFYQFASSYFNFQIGVYVQELFVFGMVQLSCLIVLATLCHVVSPNKYIGYFIFIALVVINTILWPLLGVESKMFQFGVLPNYVYSDMFGRAPYASALHWFSLYWLLLAALISVAAILLWPRGRERGVLQRIELAIPRWKGGLRWGSIGIAFAWLASAGWIFWNTQVLNTDLTHRQTQKIQADYEKKFKSLAQIPQPRVTDIRYDIDLYPERRKLVMHGKQRIENQESSPIEEIYLYTANEYDTTIQISGATQIAADTDSGMVTFKVSPPMEPGSTREMKFTVAYDPVGFENSLQVQQIVQNGTFFNNFIAPQIGYQPGIQLKDNKQRKRFGLSGTSFPELDPENLEARRNTYLSNNSDWVNVETVISTSGDQIAIAPGSLVKSWEEEGRRFFHYKLDHPSVNFYSFVSARYKLAMQRWKDVDIEVYYHPHHERNVDLMLRSVRKSLEYYSEAFGPYRHKQARIVEIPRVSMFAQAFPGTMPYSEGVGFIADLQDPDDIDMVYYVVAHEVAHQWWAHQVIGANMKGATVLSETLAQYSALMVMEKEYGRDMMRKFLRYEMDNYLRARGNVDNKELPLKEVEFEQGFVHYNKGSVAMYHLKETIGEDKLNAALRSVVDKFAYANSPYPTSVDLIEAIRKHTPAEHHGLLVDLFDHVTLFANRTVNATYTETQDGKFEISLEVEFQKLRADEDGNETEIAVDDWIEIGAFAKPDFGSEFGETLHRERIHITEPKGTFSFIVEKKPALVGVDPFSLLIDRNSKDNMKSPDQK